MLEIKDLVKVYPGPVTALQGVSLEMPKGMFGVLGPNGSGKTTLMKILTGLLEPTAGTVTLDGQNIIEKPEYVWRRLGYLPQDFGFYNQMTGEAMLRHMLRLKGVTSPQGLSYVCDSLLEQVNLQPAAKRKVKTYSGGMKQRLGIAQAIAGDPGLLIVDEPTAGLDPEERMRFYRLLSELAADRIVLLTTHIVEDVAVLCSRFAVIRHGKVIETTSPSEARASIAGEIYEGSISQQELQKLQSSHTITRAYLFEGNNRVRIHVEAGNAPDGFVQVPPTLEDAYMLMQQEGAIAEVEGGVA